MSASLPLIARPVRAAARRRGRLVREQVSAASTPTTPAVIQCKRTEFNLFEVPRPGYHVDPGTLASRAWRHKKSVGDHFVVKQHQEPAFLSSSTFRELGLSPSLVSHLSAAGFTTPSTVQKDMFQVMMRGASITCAAETGSGKTLAYLLPLAELSLREDWPDTPRAVIIVPSRELAYQAAAVADSLSAASPLRVTAQKLRPDCGLQTNLSVLTPRQLQSSHLPDLLAGVRHLVLDEADTLTDDTFLPIIQPLLQYWTQQHSSPPPQTVLVSATLPDANIAQSLGHIFPADTMVSVRGAGLHELMRHVTHTFRRCSARSRPGVLLELVKRNLKSATPTLIFCNKFATFSFVSKLLEENFVPHSRLSGGMRPGSRDSHWREMQSGRSLILVATDLASRGLDLPQMTEVINYEFPATATDYLHRSGRVGRLNSISNCGVTSLVSQPWEVELVQLLELSVRRQRPVSVVSPQGSVTTG